MTGLKVEELRLVGEPGREHYVAVVVNGHHRVGVHRRYGSWQTDTRREVMPGVAAMLQAHVRRLERREARGSA